MTGTVWGLKDMLYGLQSWLTFLPRITLRNLCEIAIIAFLIYEVLIWIKNTKAWDLLKGILTILAFAFLVAIAHFDTILWILEKTTTIALTALIIIFQPELRRALEQLGSQRFFPDLLAFDDGKEEQKFTERTASEIVRATFEMARVKTGALIVIERQMSLKDIERTGIGIEGIVTSQLLINIFEHNTPLHDGAVIIRGNRVTAATCYLPLSDNMMINKALGTRHRAAVGISEVSDSITVVVSEETGRVSLVEGGMLRRITEPAELKNALMQMQPQEEAGTSRFMIWKGRKRHERKAD